jgi:hypothetical protein
MVRVIYKAFGFLIVKTIVLHFVETTRKNCCRKRNQFYEEKSKPRIESGIVSIYLFDYLLSFQIVAAASCWDSDLGSQSL